MSSVSLPVTRPAGQALVVGSSACRDEPAKLLRRQGFQCHEADDPYAAMAELARPGAVYKALVLSLNGLFREELPLVAAVKRRFPLIEIWLTQTDGRSAALAEAMRFGADGLLSEDGFHRTTASPVHAAPPAPLVPVVPVAAPVQPVPAPSAVPAPVEPDQTDSREADSRGEYFPTEPDSTGEPVLTAEELRALLQEQPFAPPGSEPRK